MLTRQAAAQQRQQQQQQPQAAALQNRPDSMLGAGSGTAGWASLCEQAPQPTARYYQPQADQQQGYGGGSVPPPQQQVLNLAKVSRNNESQRTPRRAADAAAAQHHQQHLNSLQAQLGAGGAACGALPMNVDGPNEGLTLPGPSLSEARLGSAHPAAQRAAPPSARQQQALAAAQYQQQARYVVPSVQQYLHSGRLPASSAALGSGMGAQQAQQQQAQQQQQQAPASARGFMQRLPQFFGGGGGRGARGGGDATPASARAAPANSRPPVNPYLQALPSATARPHYPGASDGGKLPPLQGAPATARNPGPATARSPSTFRPAPAGPAVAGSGSDVFSRLSQGLPSVETARTARLQAARAVPAPPSQRQLQFREAVQVPLPATQRGPAALPPRYAPSGTCPAHPQAQPRQAPQQQQAMTSRWAAVQGEQLLSVDSPSGSTGLTPRAAGLMRPSPASPHFAATARQQPQVLPGSVLDPLQGQGMQPRSGSDSGHLFAAAGHSYAQPAMAAQQPQQCHQVQYQQPQQVALYAAAPAAAQGFAVAQPPLQQQQPAWRLPGQQQPAGVDPFAKLQGYAQAPAAMTGSWDKPVGGLRDSGPLEGEAIRAVHGQSQAHAAQQQMQYPPVQQRAAPASLHSSYGTLGTDTLELPAQQQQQWAAPAAAQAQPAPGWEWGRQPQQAANCSFVQGWPPQQAQVQQAQYPPTQQAQPLLPGLPYIEHAPPAVPALLQQTLAAVVPPSTVAAAVQQLPPQYQPPPPGSDLDLIAAVTEEVVEYDMLRQQELEQQQQQAAVAAAARRVSQLAAAPPAAAAQVPTPTSLGPSPARAGSSRSSRRASPLGSGAGSPDSPTGPRPLTAARGLQQWSHLLTPYEHSEILSFPAVWFVGKPGAPKIRGDKSSLEPNHGYDDSRGDYLSVVGDHIAYRFEVMGTLGRGSFGQVLRCFDHARGQPVALKMIRSKRRFQKQAAIEAGILALLKEKDPDDAVNIVRTHESFTFRNHLCITFELLSINLYEHVKANNFQGSGLSMIRRVAQQVLVTLRFLLRLNIVHCDLKPENILLRERGRAAVKVIDFGSSCYADQRVYTYIQSRFYRSPEVILGLPYGPPIDMWSLGCILAELLTGQPIFPGEDEREQLACILELLGPPPRSLLEQAPRAGMFFDAATWHPLPHQNSRGKARRPASRTWERALGSCEDRAFLNFLQRCLVWEPELRMTPDQALQHPWVTGGALAPQLLRSCHLASGVGSAQSAAWPASGSSSQESGAGSGPASLVSGLLSGTAQVAAGLF